MITKYIIIKGRVQGVGYRPFVAETAEQFNIKGWVRNTSGIVSLMITGEETAILLFIQELQNGCSGALVESINVNDADRTDFDDFKIIESNVEGEDIPYIIPDIATCESCLLEMRDATNRRYRHSFISCVSCGPRYSIIEQLPYDRDNITMKNFKMCPECGREYVTNGKRHHAQTIACNECGPILVWYDAKNDIQSDAPNNVKDNVQTDGFEAIDYAISYLKSGGIVAVKDIGGYHFACLPGNSEAINRLRELKSRYAKPFAVMFPDVEEVRQCCEVSDLEACELQSVERPIVLLRKNKNIYKEVCKNSPYMGAMLPCNPVQTMLVEKLGPLVMTSANKSGELIITDDTRILQWNDIGILMHDRDIVTPLDDSIVRIVAGRKQILRRARGYVPSPVLCDIKGEILALGGDLKSVFCYTCDNKAYLSQQFGDLEDEAALISYKKEKQRMKKLFGFKPDTEVCDLHPGYISAKNSAINSAINSEKDVLIRVQHHKAHIASVIAEHHISEDVIGVAFDGTGYGEDGCIWGSEFFVVKNNSMKRMAHLKNIGLLGGNEGAKNTRYILYGYINSFTEDTGKLILDEIQPDYAGYNLITKAINGRINRVNSSSMGRLFDAVSALLGICYYNSYEGEAAIELEYVASDTEKFYPLSISVCYEKDIIGDTEKLFEDIVKAMRSGVSVSELARGFIYAVGDLIIKVCQIINESNDSELPVVMSGGTFLNRILVEYISKEFDKRGIRYYFNEKVPTGDAGICLGQAYLASVMKGE